MQRAAVRTFSRLCPQNVRLSNSNPSSSDSGTFCRRLPTFSLLALTLKSSPPPLTIVRSASSLVPIRSKSRVLAGSRGYHRHRRRTKQEEGGDDRNENNDNSDWSRTDHRPPFAYAIIGSSLYWNWEVFKNWISGKTTDYQLPPVRVKVEEALSLQEAGRKKEAAEAYHAALMMAQDERDEMAITAIMDNLGACYLELGDLELARRNYTEVLTRLMQLHQKSSSDHQFIAVSVMLAQVLAQQGELVKADAGFRHCIAQQEKVVMEHQGHYLREKGAQLPQKDPTLFLGEQYTAPLALFGLCLELYAHFLITYPQSGDRSKEAVELIRNALSIAHDVYGPLTVQTVNMLNNFAVRCIWANRYEIAREYLADVIAKAVHMQELSDRLPGFYCNYAEALFHCGQKKEALEYAERGAALAGELGDRALADYARTFLNALRADIGTAPQRQRPTS